MLGNFKNEGFSEIDLAMFKVLNARHLLYGIKHCVNFALPYLNSVRYSRDMFLVVLPLSYQLNLSTFGAPPLKDNTLPQ